MELDLEPIEKRLEAAKGLVAEGQGGPRPLTPVEADFLLHGPCDIAALLREVRELRQRNADLFSDVETMIRPDATKLVSFKNGKFQLESPMFRVILAGLLQMMHTAAAKNYLELKLGGFSEEDLVLTVQYPKGQTPHEARLAAEAEVARLRGVIIDQRDFCRCDELERLSPRRGGQCEACTAMYQAVENVEA